MTTLEGYTLTAHTAVEAVRRVVAGGIATGFQTPSKAFGKEFVLSMPATSVDFEYPAEPWAWPTAQTCDASMCRR